MIRAFLLLLLFPFSVFSQENLVVNPSFEDYTKLPVVYSNDGVSFISGWYIPSFGSVDYFHFDCSSIYLDEGRTNLNFSGCHSGNACIGIIPFSWDGYMEHITGKLIRPLEKGNIYKVSFWIKYAGDVCEFSTDRIGVLFTRERFQLYPFDPFYESLYNGQIRADIESQERYFYTNDSVWQEVNFLYKAVGGEKYITLGKFYNEKIELNMVSYYRKANVQLTDKRDKFIMKKKSQNVLQINENYNIGLGGVASAYYYIDDVNVSLIKIE